MAKKRKRTKVPKKIMGFKLSKGTRKDIRKLLGMFGDPDTRKLAMTAASGLAAYLAQRFVENKPAEEGQGKRPSRAH